MNEPLAEAFFSPATTAGAVATFAVFSFLGFGGGEWLFGGPTAHEARMMRARFHQECVLGRDKNKDGEYCRTHGSDGLPLSKSQIAARDRKWNEIAARQAEQERAKPNAADKAKFEALLKEASR